MGFQDLRTFNLAMLVKQGWRIIKVMILYYRSVSKRSIFLDHLFLMLRNRLVALMFGGVWWLPRQFFKLGIVGGSAIGVQLW